MNAFGIVVGVTSLLIIGVFHPIVVKSEYYFSDSIWPVFLLLGVVALMASCLTNSAFLSATLGVLGVTLLWSIHELQEQTERVRKGWFPSNPKRKG